MQVKKRLHINVAVSAITAFFIVLVVLLSLGRVYRAREESELANEILSSAFERSTFRSDYLRTNGERARVQWFAKHEQISKLLEAASEKFTDSEDRKIIDGMIKDHEATKKIFSSIVENRENAGSGPESAALSSEKEDRLASQLEMKLYDKVLNARKLRESAAGHLSSALTLAGWGIICLTAVVAVAAIINSLSLGRTIVSRIWKIREGATVIGEGNLDYRIDIRGDDEFADLSNAFNAMTVKLRASYLELKNEIAERKRAEQALRGSEEQYRGLFQNMIEGYAYCKMIFENGKPLDFIYLSVNHAFETLTGLKNVAGKRATEVIPGIREADLKLFEIYGRVSLTGKPERFEMFVEALKMWFSVSVYSPEKEFFVAVFDVITERKRAEEERERLITELRRSNTELEQFAYVASHDLQEPLRMVGNYTTLLEMKYKERLDEKAREYIGFAVEGAERMHTLIEGLLAYSRITRRGAEFKRVDMNKVFSLAVSNLSVTIRENQAEITKDDLPVISGDEMQLGQLFQNLIANGVKYRKPGVPPRVHVSAKNDGKNYVFSVRDNGIGIEPRYHDKIFQIFQRLHARSEYSGTGIGLSLCKRIVERHHGRIWVESVPGTGSTFFFSISV